MLYSKHSCIPRTLIHAPGSARSRRGMTLVETVVALFIAVFLIAAILTSVIVAARLFNEAKALTNATNIVNQEIESLRSLTYSGLVTDLAIPTNGTSAQTPTTPKRLRVGNQEFTVSRSSCYATNIVPAGGGSPTVNNTLIETTVTVSWVIGGRTHRTSTTTAFSDNGYAAKS